MLRMLSLACFCIADVGIISCDAMQGLGSNKALPSGCTIETPLSALKEVEVVM